MKLVKVWAEENEYSESEEELENRTGLKAKDDSDEEPSKKCFGQQHVHQSPI